MNLDVNDAALDIVRPLFIAVEGDCEVWEDAEIVRRVFIRGAMEYAKSAGKPWEEVMGTATQLRSVLSGGS